MPVTKVKIESFVAASRTYLEKNLEKVNTVGSKATIRASEAKNLPKDLRDNVAKLAPDGKAIEKSKLVAGYMKDVTAALKKADANKDGYLTLTEAKKLPAHVRDNFNNFANAAGGAGTALKVKDTTPKLLIAAHQAEYTRGRRTAPNACRSRTGAGSPRPSTPEPSSVLVSIRLLWRADPRQEAIGTGSCPDSAPLACRSETRTVWATRG